MTKELVFSIINSIESTGFKIFSMVCDMGGSNRGLFRDLGINASNNHFSNPYDSSRNIHVFADPPHLIKLIRNNLLDYDWHTPLGIINADSIRSVIANETGDFKLCPKLSLNLSNLSVRGFERQNVKCATQILSETMANAIMFEGNHERFGTSNWKITADSILLFDKWFDILNFSSFSDKSSRKQFTNNLNQLEILNDMIEMMKSSRVGKFRKLLPFQIGVIISSKSIQSLYLELTELYSIRYILTRRLNQDVIEHSFGIIRQMGHGYVHINPVNFKCRLKSYILGRTNIIISRHQNTKLADNLKGMCSLSEMRKFSSPVKRKLTIADRPESDDDNESCLSAILLESFHNMPDFDDENDSSHDSDFIMHNMPEREQYAMSYFLGFVVRKFKFKYPFLKDECSSKCDD